MSTRRCHQVWAASFYLSTLFVSFSGLLGNAQEAASSQASTILSTGQVITPLAPQGATFQALNPQLADNPTYTVGQAVTTAISPDGKTLLLLTSGYNRWAYTSGPNAGKRNPTDSTEFVFVFDISSGTAVQKQAIAVPNTYGGTAFNPTGEQFYVSGGEDDDVHVFGTASGAWSEVQQPVALGHLASADRPKSNYGGLGLKVPPMAAGLAVSQNGQIIVVADYENDSISVLTKVGSVWAKSGHLDLRPGVINSVTSNGVPGGEYPYWVSIKGNKTAYVSSIRDREIDVVNIAGMPTLTTRIAVPGNPNRSLLNADQSLLYVAQDNSDSVAIISTDTNKVVGEIKAGVPAVHPRRAPASPKYNGANPNSLALSPDGTTLYVTDGGLNAVAVVRIRRGDVDDAEVAGLIPTGFYPNSVSVSADGKHLYIANGKSANGPNLKWCHNGVPNGTGANPNCNASNEYDLQLTKAGFQTVPTPSTDELSKLTAKVLKNDNLANPLSREQTRKMAALHRRIKHVIYIIKENRTYDQILGDLPVGNGDPDIVQFGDAVTPNQHALASEFVDFDNFYDAAEVSYDGWAWSTSARTTDVVEKEFTVNYAGRGLSYDSEGTNRNINVGIGDFSARTEANPLGARSGNTRGGPQNLLPGTLNVAAPDSSEGGMGDGYIWNAANQAGLSVRNYGMFIDLARYNLRAEYAASGIPEERTPFASHLQVSYPTNPFLAQCTDVYFRGFDNSMPDYYRFQEWNREFQQFDSNGNLPALSLVRLMHDHTGSFGTSLDGVNTPELDVADNDYALGLLVQAVANSKRYKDNTLIFVIEDDSQDGSDHVDAHRSIAFIAGPYVKRGYVDSTRYNTVSMLRTIEDILGMPHLNLNDASANPMADAFDLGRKDWAFKAVPSALLANTSLPIPKTAYKAADLRNPPKPLHSSTWWAEKTEGMNFAVPDDLDERKYNHILWAGVMGDAPYPAERSGLDLRANRAELLRNRRAKRNSRPHQASSPFERNGSSM